MFFNSEVDALLPGAVHLTFLLLALCVVAFRRPVAPAWRRAAVVALLAWSWIFSAPVVANAGLKLLEGEVPAPGAAPAADPATLVVVLASGERSHRGGPLAARLDGPGMARLAAGVSLWRSTGGRLALVGGLGVPGEQGASASLADAMTSLAREWGVPAEAIVTLPGSSRTQQDLLVASPVVRANTGPVWLVTSAMHMPRAMATAARLGLQLKPHRCDYRQFTRLDKVAWLPNAGSAPMFAEVLHELIGLAYYRWRAWA